LRLTKLLGNDVLLSLRAYLLPAAFKTSFFSSDEIASNKAFAWPEGKETPDEQVLMERRASLLQLFDTVNLKAKRKGTAPKPLDQELGQSKDKSTHKSTAGVSKKEVIGDEEEAEEVEVEGEELSENQLNVIYKKFVLITSSQEKLDLILVSITQCGPQGARPTGSRTSGYFCFDSSSIPETSSQVSSTAIIPIQPH
jgi:hypothetical protein